MDKERKIHRGTAAQLIFMCLQYLHINIFFMHFNTGPKNWSYSMDKISLQKSHNCHIQMSAHSPVSHSQYYCLLIMLGLLYFLYVYIWPNLHKHLIKGLLLFSGRALKFKSHFFSGCFYQLPNPCYRGQETQESYREDRFLK